MSGLCGFLNLDGAPADRQILARMTATLAFRGPDAQEIWTGGAAGLGHTQLRTTFEAERETQPCSLDGQVWICADARVDGRAELRSQLEAVGRSDLHNATDVELILHAYHAWGELCVEHLLGDFAFALWDGPRRKLFCARDPFGVKPFFYARTGPCLIFSNTLDCLREHPAVSDALDDLAIADFLLFESSQDPAATVFADIRRLPPAHTLAWTTAGLTVRRYWSLPTDLGIRYRAAGDYVAHFKELLDQAVSDRLRCARVGVEMSGGLDSTAVAARARALMARPGGPSELRAHAVVYDHLIPDDERHFAELAADFLGIPLRCFPADAHGLYDGRDRPETRTPEPCSDPRWALYLERQQEMADQARVWLTGWDGDTLLNESPKPYFRHLLKSRQFGRLLAGVAGYAYLEQRLLPHGWRRSGKDSPPPADQYPPWLEPALEQRFHLRDRWAQVQAARFPPHPLRPAAHAAFALMVQDGCFFDPYDAAWTRRPVEYRHPLLDLRLVTFCLALPPHPWCVKKRILRLAMRGLLPEPVLQRPKTSLAGWPHLALLAREESRGIHPQVAAPGLERYVREVRLPNVFPEADPERALLNLRPVSLNIWLQHLQSNRATHKKEPT